MTSLEQIKKLRSQTGAGVVDVKKAFDEAAGDEERALTLLRERGQAKALKKSDRAAHEGIVAAYIHSNKRVGAMVKLSCETDFVALTDEFQDLARDIAMHITAADSLVLRPEDVAPELIEKEKAAWREQLKSEGKSEDMIEQILTGKEKKFREERALLTQSFIKDPDKTIKELLAEKIGSIGENIQVGDFARFEL